MGKLGRCSLVPPGASSWLLLCQMISTFSLGQSSFKSQDFWSKDVKSIYPRKVKSILSIPEKSYINKNDSNNLFTDLKIFGNSPSRSISEANAAYEARDSAQAQMARGPHRRLGKVGRFPWKSRKTSG